MGIKTERNKKVVKQRYVGTSTIIQYITVQYDAYKLILKKDVALCMI